jgi:hypothetical protein
MSHALAATRDKFSHFFVELWRVRWPLVISLCVLYGKAYGWIPPDHPLAVLATKSANVSIGFILAHVLRQQAFSYVDLGEMLDERSPYFGLAFLGMSIIYGSVIVALALSL